MHFGHGLRLDDDRESVVTLERVYRERGEWELAFAAMLRTAELSESEEALGLLRQAAHFRIEQMQDRDGAEAAYVRILELDPHDVEALQFRSERALADGDTASAVSLLQALEPKMLEREVVDFDDKLEVSLFFYQLGECLRQVDQADEASTRYRKALEVNTSHIPSLEALGPYYVDTCQWEEAQGALQQLLQLSGGTGDPAARARIYALLGVSQFHLGDLDRAKKRLSRALELQPGDVTALKGMSLVFEAQQDWNGLLNVYNNVIFHARDPGDVVGAYLAKGRVLDDHFNLPDKAGQHYVKCLELEADQAYALLGLAELQLRSGLGDEADTYLERIAVESGDARLSGLLALAKAGVKALAGDSEGATAAVADAKSSDPAMQEALEGLGEVTGESVSTLLRTALGSR